MRKTVEFSVEFVAKNFTSTFNVFSPFTSFKDLYFQNFLFSLFYAQRSKEDW